MLTFSVKVPRPTSWDFLGMTLKFRWSSMDHPRFIINSDNLWRGVQTLSFNEVGIRVVLTHPQFWESFAENIPWMAREMAHGTGHRRGFECRRLIPIPGITWFPSPISPSHWEWHLSTESEQCWEYHLQMKTVNHKNLLFGLSLSILSADSPLVDVRQLSPAF